MHRVQRVPVTESQGRIHTSAAGVLVLPEAEDGRRPDRPERPAHRRVPVQRPRRPEREHHRLGRPHHPRADRHRRLLPEREEPAPEQGAGHAHPAGPAARRRRRRRPTPPRRPSARARSARSTAPSGSAPTTSRRTASPTTASGFKAYNLDQVLDGDLDAVIQALVDADMEREARRIIDAHDLLLDEIARATARLAEAGVPSPRADAEEHRGVRPRGAAGRAARGARRATSTRCSGRASPGGRPASRCSTSPGGPTSATWSWRSGPGVFVPRPETEVVAGWAIEHAACDGRRRPGGRGSRHRLRRHRAVHRPGGARAAVHAVEVDPRGLRPSATPATSRSSTTAAGSALHLGDFADALREPRRHGRSGGQQPALHPDGASGSRVPEDARLRPAAARCGAGRRRPRRGPGGRADGHGGCCAPAGASPWSTATSRAPGLLGLRRGERLARHPQPPGPDRPGPLRHRPPRGTD